MFFSFRSKLFALSVALIVAFLAVTGTYLHQVLKGWTETRIEEDLETRSQLVGNALVHLDEGKSSMDLLEALSESNSQRITLIDLDGRVIADTHLSAEKLREVESHESRPEFQAALTDGYGRAQRHSTSLNTDMLYAAVLPVDEGPVVRLAVPLKDVDQVLDHLRLLLIIGGFFGLGVAIFMSSFASSLMSRTLQNLLAKNRASTASLAMGEENSQISQSRSLREITGALDDTMASLARERDQSRAILDGMSEGLVATDQELQIVLSNHSAIELLDTQKSPKGRHLRDFIPSDFLASLLEELQTTGQADGEFDLRTPPLTEPSPGGSLGTAPRRIHARATIRPDGGIILVFRDITALRRLETIRRDFVANVSHELRTPVTIIQANAETLLDGALDSPEHARRFAEGIHRNSERLARLIGDLLDISRIEAGQRNFEFADLQLRQAAQRAAEATLTDETRRELSMEIPEDWRVVADAGALDQILINLLDNAVKHASPGGAIEVRAHRQDEMVVIEVADDGPGIDKIHQDRLFERFYRVDEGRSTEMGGTGLGLSITKHLVTSMNGELGYRPRDDRNGSIFWFSLKYS